MMLASAALLAPPLGLAAWARHFGANARIPTQPLDGLIVLGARVYEDGSPSPAYLGRLERAAQLVHAGLVTQVLVCGAGTGPVREAEVGRTVLASLGVDPARVHLELESRDTSENARFGAPRARALGWARPGLVSDAFHLLRARACFAREGLPVVVVPSTRRTLFPVRRHLLEAMALLRRPWLLRHLGP
jgi:uncharacterized SAM-binding protein YcdF (DUF218 family)